MTAREQLTAPGALLRFAAALVLVYATFNPEGVSYYHWALQPLVRQQPTQPSGDYSGPTHPRSSAKHLGSKPRKRSIVEDMRLQPSVSLASRRRPAAVMA